MLAFKRLESKVWVAMAGLLTVGNVITHMYDTRVNTHRRLHDEHGPKV